MINPLDRPAAFFTFLPCLFSSATHADIPFHAECIGDRPYEWKDEPVGYAGFRKAEEAISHAVGDTRRPSGTPDPFPNRMVNGQPALSRNAKRTSPLPGSMTGPGLAYPHKTKEEASAHRMPPLPSAHTQCQSVSLIRFRLIRARRAAFCSACFLLPPLAGPKHFGPMKTFT